MKRALIVDDDETVADVLKEMLEMFGHEVTVVNRVKKAIPLCEEQGFDVIFSDLKMPDIKGDEFLEELHRRGLPLPERFFLITGADMSEDLVEKISRLGGKVLRKPFHLKDIEEALKGL